MTPAPLVIAHRGASGYRPEHTRSAYLLAIEQGADAIEPDIVSTSDRVLVLRHENEISGTTDVAEHPEFADRRTTKLVDGQELTGWFTEDFTWAELDTLRATERLPLLREANRAFDGAILRLVDLLEILDAADRPIALVAEVKHASYFESIGLPLGELLAGELAAAGWTDDPRLTIESFELTVLRTLRARGIGADLVFLLDASGAPADDPSHPFADYLTPDGLAALAAEVDGISVDKLLLLRSDAAGNAIGVTDLVDRAHAAGLTIFCWTLRAENEFLARNLRLGTSSAAFGDWRREYLLIMASGVDGVFADHPDLAVEARAAL
ncbi:MAG: glycerophosphodiester phosphodiesterase [Microbacteriaceae bacterium]|nr:glycerophosphodiester phosphodiesterase [Microbacteriaceae bacterium]